MDIIFHIEYYVYAGEQVAINIVDAADGVTLHRHLMTTADNAHWTFDWNADAWTADAADYFFTIERADTTLRREWTAIRHRRPAATPADLGEGLLPMDRHAPRHL